MMKKQLISTSKTFLCFCAAFALLATSGLASADKDKDQDKIKDGEKTEAAEPAVELSAEHLGMSREALGSDKVVDSEEDEESEEDEVKTPRSEADRKGMKKREHRRMKDGKKQGKKCGKKCGGKHGDHAECGETCKARRKGKGPRYNYKSCLEASIRAKNSYDESERVCKSLFPATDS